MKACPYCGTAYPDGATTCSNDQSPLVEAPPESVCRDAEAASDAVPSPPQTTQRPRWNPGLLRELLVVLAVPLGALACLLAWLTFREVMGVRKGVGKSAGCTEEVLALVEAYLRDNPRGVFSNHGSFVRLESLGFQRPLAHRGEPLLFDPNASAIFEKGAVPVEISIPVQIYIHGRHDRNRRGTNSQQHKIVDPSGKNYVIDVIHLDK